jgi:hypothetical protein
VIYAESAAQGLAVMEMSDESEAAHEVRRLIADLFRQSGRKAA